MLPRSVSDVVVGRGCSAAFEMKIIVSDPAIPRRAVEGLGYEYCSDFRERLGDADVVIHCI